jgi:hypothetical protein
MGLPLVSTLAVEVVTGERASTLAKLPLCQPVLWNRGGIATDTHDEC